MRPLSQRPIRRLERALARLAFRALIVFVTALSVPGPALARWWAPNQQADTNEQENHTPSRVEPTQAARRLGDVPSPEGEHDAFAKGARRRHLLEAASPPAGHGEFIPRPYKTRFSLLI